MSVQNTLEIYSDKLGNYKVTLVAVLDTRKVNETDDAFWLNKFHPVLSFPNSHSVKDGFKWLVYVPLAKENENWYEDNKVLLNKQIPHQWRKNFNFPTIVSDETFLMWYMHSRKFFHDDWLQSEKESIASWDVKVDKQYMKMVEASKVGYRLGVFKAVEWSMDLNYQDSIVLKNLVLKSNLELIDLVLQCGAVVNDEVLEMASGNDKVRELLLSKR